MLGNASFVFWKLNCLLFYFAHWKTDKNGSLLSMSKNVRNVNGTSYLVQSRSSSLRMSRLVRRLELKENWHLDQGGVRSGMSTFRDRALFMGTQENHPGQLMFYTGS